MFSDLDRDDVVNLAKIIGIILFLASFFLPAVTNSYALSRTDYLITNDAYHGWACAAWTLYGTVAVIASFFGPNGANGEALFFVISGWITPLVMVFGILLGSDRTKQRVAMVLPFLLVAPLLVFVWPESGSGAGPLRPLIGHYVWTVGCLLILAPQYVQMLDATSKRRRREPDVD